MNDARLFSFFDLDNFSMLTTLTINNFTIVKQLHLDFQCGMTAFTGETGAGKSIMIDALTFLLGARADVAFIRDGTECFDLSASFCVKTNPEALAWLTFNDIALEDELILRRTLTLKGRSKAFINGTLYPLQKVRELGDLLLHIHGQNEQYHLLKHELHCEQLDAYASNNALLNQVKSAYKKLHLLELKILELENIASHSDQKALLSYQLEELNQLSIQDDEINSLTLEHKSLSNASEIISNSQKIIDTLQRDTKEGILSGLSIIQNHLQTLDYEHVSLNNFKELFTSAQIQLEEGLSEIIDYQQQLEINPERLFDVENRLENIYDLARKHHVSAEHLMDHQAALENQLAALVNNEKLILALREQKKDLLSSYHSLAKELSKKREKEAPELATEITKLISHLGMPAGKVIIQIDPLDKPSITGLDKVEYKVSLNPGSALRPLGKIASGGELSRLSLAIQVLTAEKKAYPTLMFDEVDTGIGGSTAAKVGQLLRRLGTHTQVFCVTHQAQVASNANWHMKVEKMIKDNQTYSTLKLLMGEDKIEELARMISGVEMTEQTLAHAKALLEQVSA